MKKTQILLSHTSRTLDGFIDQMNNRYGGSSERVPHILIDRKGIIHELMDPRKTSNFFVHEGRDKLVHICLENLGWLEKVPLTNNFTNWMGISNPDPIYEKEWRGYFFWDKYPEEQIKALAEACDDLIKTMGIKRKFVGRNIKLTNVHEYNGIAVRSNYNSYFTDLNPSFPYIKFNNTITNGEPLR